MPITADTPIVASSKGDVATEAIDRATERLGRVADHCREAVTKVDVRITMEQPVRGEPRCRAEATFEVTKGPIRAQDSASTVDEAVDGMIERLRRRVDQHESRLHRDGKERRGVASVGQWHHGDVANAPRHPLPLPDGPSTVIRRKSFAPAPMSVEEAVFDLEILDHDFYLFEESSSGETALVSRAPEGRFHLHVSNDATIEMRADLPIDRSGAPLVLDLASAQLVLERDPEPFVFHRPAEGRSAQVLYRRFDGGYGVIELGS